MPSTAVYILAVLCAFVHMSSSVLAARVDVCDKKDVLIVSLNLSRYAITMNSGGQAILDKKFGLRFRIVPGLSGQRGSLSFQDVKNRLKYLRHRNDLMFIDTNNRTPSFAADASFFDRPGLDTPNAMSYESVNFPRFFIRHQNLLLRISEFINEPLFRKDASWFPIY